MADAAFHDQFRAPGAAAYPAAADPLRLLSFAALLGLVLFSVLDAVGNRLTDGLPLSAYALCYGATMLLALACMAGERRPRLSGIPAPGARWAVALLLWAVAAWTLSTHRAEGWDYLKGFALAIGPMILVVRLADTPQRLEKILWTVLLGGAASALIVHYDILSGGRLVSRATAAVSAEYGGVARSAGGSDENPTTAAHMILVSLALALGLLAGKARHKAALVLAAIAMIAALGLMGARSAIVGAAVLALLLLWRQRRSAVFPLYVGLFLLAGTAAFLLAPATLGTRFLAVFDWSLDPTLYRRMTYLRVGIDLWADSPMWGVGPGNFPLHYADAEYRYLPGREASPRELHNTYLDVAVELGLVGLALFAALLVSALRSVRAGLTSAGRNLRGASLAIGLALAVLLVASIFMPNKDMRLLWIVLGLAVQCGRLRAAEASGR
jgi:O-antigen ligase